MKKNKLRIALATIISIIVLAIIVSAITCTYYFNKIDHKWLWIPLIVFVFVFDVVCALVMFSQNSHSDESKAYWLFIILLFSIFGSIFWLFLGRRKQVGLNDGKNNQATLLSHLFKAKKSIKIYTNSLFLTIDIIKALNYASWKDVKVDIVVCNCPKKWKQNVMKYDINKFYEPKVKVLFTNKEIEHNFVIVDDKEVLFSTNNFNCKYMYVEEKLYLADDVTGYLALWNRDFIRSSEFEHNQAKPRWTIRLKYGIINIFYPFF